MKSASEIEVEVKIPLNDPAGRQEIEAGLAARGFILLKKYVQTDTYYNHPDYDLRRMDKALRIRRETDLDTGRMTATLNYKGKKLDDRTMTRTEIETILDAPDDMEKILEGIGYHLVEPLVRKERHDYYRENVVLSLDRVDGLGEFLEIEVKASSAFRAPEALEGAENAAGGGQGMISAGNKNNLSSAGNGHGRASAEDGQGVISAEERLRQLDRVMEELGFRSEDTVRRSYLSMLQEKGQT